jgi:hypothetical protein
MSNIQCPDCKGDATACLCKNNPFLWALAKGAFGSTGKYYGDEIFSGNVSEKMVSRGVYEKRVSGGVSEKKISEKMVSRGVYEKRVFWGGL